MKTLVEDFREKTQYDLQNYFRQVDTFIRTSYPKIIEFYSSQKNAKVSIRDSFLLLESLTSESNTVLSIIQNYSNSLDSRFWDIVELVDDIKLSLQYIENTPKWLRSSLSKGRYSYGIENEELLKQRETLESLSKRLGSSNKETDWAYIALRNDLPEEDYTSEGGVDLIVQYFNKLSLSLDSVIDSNIIGEKIYGRDLNKKLEFSGDDLSILTYKETITQSVNILVNLRQGDNPEFMEDGIQSSLIIGSNKNSLPYQILLRQLYSTFQKDDTLKSLKIVDLRTSEDSLILDLEIETRISEVILDNIIL